ncbi:NAD(P)/FAD-dependent oxidoreductase [Zobellia barbeyronii]|uniref:NAD(P)/FAD-dependent oxidoreductase n=1 Tax=Zobellia barbeyronii TaxID=2748009 RepID=A0ABS5WL73_9FLAO|nr:NAD(P)/FAD-dependent oxidoreductase [Zobellia barbeyronii]MBT2163555.1 NAD(P)/FAD-dependent oxidoreductase [Zobellia barbeyronii]
MKIAIVGGGFMGLVLAQKISSTTNATVKVLEQGSLPGGLSTYHNYGAFTWDKFYHVITPTDTDLIDFIDEIGLADQLQWRRSLTGYYENKRFHSISSSKEFLMFPLLGLVDKMRLGYTIFRGSRINDWKSLEKIHVTDWLIKLGGKRTYEKFWAPMLQAKLGENHKKVSAVFIWTYIKRLFKARSSAAQKEHMAYVNGGYKTIFDRLEQNLKQSGSDVMLNTEVQHISPSPEGGINITHNGATEHFDKVIFTSPLNVMEKVTAPQLYDISKSTKPIDYLGVICLILVTKKTLTPFYVLNIGDNDTPFTGVIGMSSLVDLEETANQHVTYFPKYISQDDELWSKSDEEITATFLKGVKYLYPDFNEADMISSHVHRAFKVQPMQVLNYSEIVPKVNTPHPDFYVLNTSQFVSESVNNNSVVTHVEKFVKGFKGDLQNNTTAN